MSLSGRVDGSNASQLEGALQAQVEAGETRLVLDFSQLRYISSAGLRVLLVVARRLQGVGGQMLFCELAEDIAQIFEISGFNNILEVHASRHEALKALGA